MTEQDSTSMRNSPGTNRSLELVLVAVALVLAFGLGMYVQAQRSGKRASMPDAAVTEPAVTEPAPTEAALSKPTAFSETASETANDAPPQPQEVSERGAGGRVPGRDPNPISTKEAAAVTAMRSILTAEITHMVTRPDTGFVGELGKLADEGLLDPVTASGERDGYRFVAHVSGSPGTAFFVLATPLDSSDNERSFCANESAVIRVSQHPKNCDPERSTPLPVRRDDNTAR